MPDENAGFTVNDPQVRNLIQGQQVELHMNHAMPQPMRVHSFAEGPLLIGRIPALAAARQARELDDGLRPGQSCQIFSGMAGTGKTQLAAASARALWNAGEPDLLVWANAATREAITAAFAAAGAAVCGADPSDPDRAAATFSSWLDRPRGPKWLVVLDGLVDPAHLADLWPPESRHGLTVITTRIRNGALEGASRALVEVGPFTPDEAVDYLEQRLGSHQRRAEGAAELAADLGFLPLALAQAAAYVIERPGMTCADFSAMLGDGVCTLAGLRPRTLPDEHPLPTDAALAASVQLADSIRPWDLASAVLTLASLLDPNGIPADLFTAAPALEALTRVVSVSDEAVREDSPLTSWQVKESLGSLHQLHLADYDGSVVRVHPLVQRLVHERLDDIGLRGSVQVAADALVAIYPEQRSDPEACVRFHANADRLSRIAGPLLFEPDANTVLFLAGHILIGAGRLSQAIEHFRWLSDRCEALLGPDHADTLAAKGSLSVQLGEAGDMTEAIAIGQEVYESRLRTLGPDHPKTLVARNNLALWQDKSGDRAGAVVAYESLIADYDRLLGRDHSDALAARANLLAIQAESGEPADIAAAYEALLPDFIRVLGADDPQTLMTRGNLAHWRGEAGDAAAAAAELASLLPDAERVFGPDHPESLMVRHNLIVFRDRAGDGVGTVAALEELLVDAERVFGPQHGKTVGVRATLDQFRPPE